MNLSQGDQEQALALIAQKNAPGIQAMADRGILSAQDAQAIQELMGIYAPLKEGIAQAGRLARDNQSWEILRQLSVTASMLEAFGLNGRIRLDFSLVNSMDYYNGVIFQGFLPNIPLPGPVRRAVRQPAPEDGQAGGGHRLRPVHGPAGAVLLPGAAV